MISFEHPTYIVLDLPKDIADKIMKIRADNKDEFRVSLPAEITVAGSSGVGILTKGQDENAVYKKIEEIAKTIKPFKLIFSEVKRFPGTDVFAFKVTDETELRNLHMILKDSGIHYDDIPFDYEPHCTLRSRSPITEEDVSKLYNLRLVDEFVVDTISVYTLDKIPLTKLFTVKLTGGSY